MTLVLKPLMVFASRASGINVNLLGEMEQKRKHGQVGEVRGGYVEVSRC